MSTLSALFCRPELSLLPRDYARVQPAVSSNAAGAPAVERLSPAVDALVSPGAEPIPIAGGYKWTEGPVWLSSNRLLFAEIPSNSRRIWTPGAGVSMFMQASGYKGGVAPGQVADRRLESYGAKVLAGGRKYADPDFKTLYITASSAIYSRHVLVPGLPPRRPAAALISRAPQDYAHLTTIHAGAPAWR